MVSIKIEDPEQLKVSGLDLDDLNKSRQCVLIVEDEPDTILLLKSHFTPPRFGFARFNDA
jgi:hypothetical protein